MLFGYKSKIFISHLLIFSLNKTKGESLREFVLYYWKKMSESEMGNPKRRQCSAWIILKWRNEVISQSITTSFSIRQFRERIQFSIQFTRALWLSSKTTKAEYGLVVTLWINIEKTKIFFFHGNRNKSRSICFFGLRLMDVAWYAKKVDPDGSRKGPIIK